MPLLKWICSLGFSVLMILGAWKFLPASSASSAKANVAFSEPSFPRLKSLYLGENKKVVDLDPKAAQSRLQEAAKSLNSEEVQELSRQMAERREPLDQRFFAIYLLGLRGDANSILALGDFASSGEGKKTKDGAEFQLRSRAVEALKLLCKPHLEARDQLLNVVEKQEDEYLREKAHRALALCHKWDPPGPLL